MQKVKKNLKLLPLVSGAKVFLFITICLFVLSSCNKSSVVGLDVQPEGDLLNVTFSDTSKLRTYIRTEDSVRSDERSINLLGSYNDPVFGKASASIFTQFNTNNVVFGNASDMLIDSVILSLAYTGDYYGSLDPQNVKVYQLTQGIFKDSIYYSKRVFGYNTTELANYNFIPKPADSVQVGSVKLKPQLRIRLSNSFGQSFLSQGGFVDNTAFNNFFKGLFITTDNTQAPGQGAILNLNLTDVNSKITLYYRNKFSGKNAQSIFSFDINPATCASVGHFEHEDAVNDITKQLGDTNLGQNLVYVQAMAGVRTRVQFPFLKNYTLPGSVSINKAELIIKVDPSAEGIYPVPTALALLTIDANGGVSFTPDQFEGDGYFGGTYNSSNKEYRFNIARYIQQVLNGKQADHGLYISTGKFGSETNAISARRAVLGGGDNTNYKMRLRLTYTKLY